MQVQRELRIKSYAGKKGTPLDLAHRLTYNGDVVALGTGNQIPEEQ
jgi:hypothetical protein